MDVDPGPENYQEAGVHDSTPTPSSAGPARFSRKCNTCTGDKQKCIWSGGFDAKCDRCEKYKYTCSKAPQISSDGDRQRRQLSYAKCDFCRRDRKKCVWSSGEWYEGGNICCDHCAKRNFECSRPQKVPRKKPDRGTPSIGSPPSTSTNDVEMAPGFQVSVSDRLSYRNNYEESDDDESMDDIGLGKLPQNSPNMGPLPLLARSPRQRTIRPSASVSGPFFPPPEENKWKRSSADWSSWSQAQWDNDSGRLPSRQEESAWAFDRSDTQFSGIVERRVPAARPTTSYSGDIGRYSSSFPDYLQRTSPPFHGDGRPFEYFSATRSAAGHSQLANADLKLYPTDSLQNSHPVLPPRSYQEVYSPPQRIEQDIRPYRPFPRNGTMPPPSPRKGTIPKSSYDYTSLDKEGEYRILVLEPGQGNQNVECSFVCSSNLNEEYEALSYVWGDMQFSCEIQIVRPKPRTSGRGLKSSGDKVHVTPNLYEALQYLRHPTEPRRLWIDAICIDQQNPKEKNQQVRIMAEIYSRAVAVIVWLGPSNPTFDTTIEFLESLRSLDLVGLDVAIRGVQFLSKWHALAKIMGHQYFRRLWVMQEVGFARRAILLSGNTAVDWQVFADGVKLFGDRLEEIRQVSHQTNDPDAARIAVTLGWIHFHGAYHLVETLNKAFYKSIDGVIVRRTWTLNELVLRLREFDCSDPRDIIFAVLSMAKESEAETSVVYPRDNFQLPMPDYEKSIAEVFTEFVEFFLNSTQSLDIICRQWAIGDRRLIGLDPNSGPPLPTWILLRPEPTHSMEENDNQSASGNTLVGADPAQPIYNSASGRKADVNFGRIISGGKVRLNMTAKGVRLGTIGTLGDRVLEGIISAESPKMGGWNGAEHGQNQLGNLPSRLWRTMVADRSSEGLPATNSYRSACLSALQYVNSSGDLDTQKLITTKDMPHALIEFLKRVRSVVWNRKFFLTQPLSDVSLKELFGIGPKGTRYGDIVCILFGCSVPVILREKREQDLTYFEFIGDAYVHRMMEGEAFTGKDPQEIEMWSEKFELR